MRNTNRLLDRALALPIVQGKGHLARLLEMGHPQLNQVLKGTRHLTTRQAWLLAEVLGMPVNDATALCHADAAKTDAEREWWLRRAPRVVAALVGVMSAALGTLAPEPANAANTALRSQPAYVTGLVKQTIHYAKFAACRLVSWITRIARGLQAPCTPGLQTL